MADKSSQKSLRQSKQGDFGLGDFLSLLKRRWHIAATLSIVMCVLLVGYQYFEKERVAVTVLSYNFQESSKGQNPNGTRLEHAILRSRDFMQEVLQRVGLEGACDPGVLVASLSVTPQIQKNSQESKAQYFISSSYQLRLTLPDELVGQITSRDLLQTICSMYRSRLYATSITTANNFDVDSTLLQDMDFTEAGDYVKLHMNMARSFLLSRINSGTKYSLPDGTSFRTLSNRLKNMIDYPLQSYYSYVWENGISRDEKSRIQKLSFLNNRLSISQVSYEGKSNMYMEVLDAYNDKLTASVLIPTYNGSSEFYMARTQTGVDSLARNADRFLENSVAALLSIDVNNDQIAKLRARSTQAQQIAASQALNNLVRDYNRFVQRLYDFDEQYVQYTTKNFITFSKLRSLKMSMKDMVVSFVESVVVVMGVFWMLSAILYRKRRRRKAPYETL